MKQLSQFQFDKESKKAAASWFFSYLVTQAPQSNCGRIYNQYCYLETSVSFYHKYWKNTSLCLKDLDVHSKVLYESYTWQDSWFPQVISDFLDKTKLRDNCFNHNRGQSDIYTKSTSCWRTVPWKFVWYASEGRGITMLWGYRKETKWKKEKPENKNMVINFYIYLVFPMMSIRFTYSITHVSVVIQKI